MSQNFTHYKFSDNQEKKNFELHVAAHTVCPEESANFNIYDETRSDFFVIAILTQGQVNLKLNLQEKKISKNSLLLLVPDTLKQLVHFTDDIHIYKVVFTAKFLLQIGINKQEIEVIDLNARASGGFIVLSDNEMHLLKKIIEDLEVKNKTVSEHPFGEDIVKHTFSIFLKEIAGIAVKHNIITSQKITRKQALVMEFGDLINTHFRKNRSVKFYADKLAITPKYLSEVVHEITGESASVLIDEKVMYEAKLLLNNPSLTIAQIAEVLHFSDQSFLGKFFKRHLGLSPTQYRNHKLA